MGAWEYGAYKTTSGTIDDRLGAAFVAIKRELMFNGFGKGVIPDTPVFGDAATNRVKDFQKAQGLKVDGQVGPTTAKALFHARVSFIEEQYALTPGTLGKLITLESAWDPVAIGYSDPDDHGLVQINLRIHSDITVGQAFDPGFSVDWAARYMSQAQDRILREINIEKAARASYNVGVEYAKRWMGDNYPASGGVFDSSGIDWYTRATTYIELIDKQVW